MSMDGISNVLFYYNTDNNGVCFVLSETNYATELIEQIFLSGLTLPCLGSYVMKLFVIYTIY